MKKLSTYTLIVMLSGIALFFDISLTTQFALPKMLILRLGTLALCLIWLKSQRQGQLQPLNRLVLMSMACFGSWLILSSFTAIHGYTALHGLYGWYNGMWNALNYLLLFYLVAVLPIDRIKVLRAYVLLMSIVATYATAQAFGYDVIVYVVQGTEFINDRPASTIGNAVPMAACLALALPFSVYFAFKNNKAWFASTIILLAGIITCRSRGVQIAVILTSVISALIFGYQHISKRNVVMIAASSILIGILSFTIFLNFASPDIQRRYNPKIWLQQDHGVIARLHYYGISKEMIKDKPIFGFGHDNFFFAYPYYRTKEISDLEPGIVPAEPHNAYLAKSVIGGLPLLAFYLFFIYAVFTNITKSDKGLSAAFTFALIAYLIQDISGWSQNTLLPMFYIIFGMGVRE